MAVPFRDLTEDDEGLGLVGYLRFVDEPANRGIRGGLFYVSARGEPIDFSFSRIDVPASFLWRPGEARRRAVAAVVKTLFTGCSKKPVLLLALADEVPARVFTEDIEVHVPLCRIAGTGGSIHAPSESIEELAEATHLYWLGNPPAPDSPARRLLEALNGRQLATEPFERAATGLEEAFRVA